MNRRSFFKALLAVPVVAALAPLLPKPVAGAFRAEDLWTAKDALRMQYGLKLWNAGCIAKSDLSDLLVTQLELENRVAGWLDVYSSPLVPKDTVYLLDTERIVEPARYKWNEDA